MQVIISSKLSINYKNLTISSFKNQVHKLQATTKQKTLQTKRNKNLYKQLPTTKHNQKKISTSNRLSK